MKKTTKIEPYKDFMSNDLWLLFIDGHRLNEGPLAFETATSLSAENPEPGYVKGMSTALKYMNAHSKDPISVDFIETVHDLCIAPIDHLKDAAKGYRDVGTGFGLLINTAPGEQDRAILSPDGLNELSADLQVIMQTQLNKNRFPMNHVTYEGKGIVGMNTYMIYQNDDQRLKGLEYCKDNRIQPKDTEHITVATFQKMLENNDLNQGIFKLTASGANKNQVREWIKKDIEVFNTELKDAKASGDETKIIETIVKFNRRCLQSHYFKDANGRTFVPLMLNHLLTQNGLSPAIIMTPNHFSGFSIKELAKEVKAGMNLFQESKITNTVNCIMSLNTKTIRESPDVARQLINESLSKHPLIQLAQLNEIYERIDNGSLTVGNKILPGWAKKNDNTLVKTILHEIYDEKLSSIKASLNGNDTNNAPVKSEAILDSITKNHNIYKDLPSETMTKSTEHGLSL